MVWRTSIYQVLDAFFVPLLAQCQLLLVHVHDRNIIIYLDLNQFQVGVCSHTILEIFLILNGVHFFFGIFKIEIKTLIAAEPGVHTLGDFARVFEFRNPKNESD